MTKEHVSLDQGSGTAASRRLVSYIASTLGSAYVGVMEDSAILHVSSNHLAVTTDSFVVDPIFLGVAMSERLLSAERSMTWQSPEPVLLQ